MMTQDDSMMTQDDSMMTQDDSMAYIATGCSEKNCVLHNNLLPPHSWALSSTAGNIFMAIAIGCWPISANQSQPRGLDFLRGKENTFHFEHPVPGASSLDISS